MEDLDEATDFGDATEGFSVVVFVKLLIPEEGVIRREFETPLTVFNEGSTRRLGSLDVLKGERGRTTGFSLSGKPPAFASMSK